MKNLILLSFCFALLFNCQDDEEVSPLMQKVDLSECYSPDANWKDIGVIEYFFDFQEGGITFNSGEEAEHPKFTLVDDNDLVFIYRKAEYGANYLARQTKETRLIFQVDNSLDFFNIESIEEFSEANCTYGYCGIAEHESQSSQSIYGSISGVKISDTEWKITASLGGEDFYGKSDIEFEEIFKIRN